MRRILLALTCRENEWWRRPLTARYHEERDMDIVAEIDMEPVIPRISIIKISAIWGVEWRLGC